MEGQFFFCYILKNTGEKEERRKKGTQDEKSVLFGYAIGDDHFRLIGNNSLGGNGGYGDDSV